MGQRVQALRVFIGAYGVPILAFLATGGLNALYIHYPVLETVGLNQTAALGLMNGLLVGLAGLLDLNTSTPAYTASGSKKAYESVIADLEAKLAKKR